MPVYCWKDKISGKTFDIYKPNFDQYNEPPKDDELPEEERGKEREWEKQIGSGIRVVKAPGFGKKGYW